MSAARDVMAAVAIHDGSHYHGEIIEFRCQLWGASDASGSLIGIYPDQRAAAHALLEAIGKSESVYG
jgi:hypothetical protein